MWEKRYLFETKLTKRRRLFLRLLFFIFIPVCFYLSFIGIIWRFALNSNQETAGFLKRKAPDIIVVYTGDEGRIPWAMKIIEQNPSTKLLISGVYNRNTTQGLVERYLGDGEQVGMEQIDLDYLAHNTVENALYTLRYLKDHPEFKSVLVVSSDYHLLRIKMAMDMMAQNGEGPKNELTVHYHGIESPYPDWRTARLFTKEVYKFWKAFVFLLLWDTET